MGQPKSTKRGDAESAVLAEEPMGTAAGKASNTPKFVTLTPLTVRLRHDQVVMLTDFERKIMGQRSQGERRERITKSTIIRVLIDLLPELLTDTSGIADECMLGQRLRAIGVK